jgi:hypothetical protein
VNLVNLTLTVAAVSAAYLGWLVVPLWLDDLDVQESLAAGAAQAMSQGLYMDDGSIRKGIVDRLSSVGYHWEEQDGRQVQVPGLGVEADDIKIERSRERRTGQLSLDYNRTVKLRPLERYWTLPFHTKRGASARP